SNRRVPGDGHFDWAGALAVMREIGYAGCLTAEFVLPVDRTPLGLLAGGGAGGGGTSDGADGGAADGPAKDIKFIQDHGGGLLSDEAYDAAVGATARYLRALEKSAAAS
ncbi:MAG TPA: hypothetical protein VFK80_03740, partial [Limnochordia bacterium]|nr:hypothetical protein [Limnochordia bacterium]